MNQISINLVEYDNICFLLTIVIYSADVILLLKILRFPFHLSAFFANRSAMCYYFVFRICFVLRATQTIVVGAGWIHVDWQCVVAKCVWTLIYVYDMYWYLHTGARCAYTFIFTCVTVFVTRIIRTYIVTLFLMYHDICLFIFFTYICAAACQVLLFVLTPAVQTTHHTVMCIGWTCHYLYYLLILIILLQVWTWMNLPVLDSDDCNVILYESSVKELIIGVLLRVNVFSFFISFLVRCFCVSFHLYIIAFV